jgi:hypothetical protein
MYVSVQDTSQCVKARYVMAFMGFLGFANVYAMRVNLSVAIVAMVNNTAISKANDSDSNDVCPVEFTNRTVIQVGHNIVYFFRPFIRVSTPVSPGTKSALFFCAYL